MKRITNEVLEEKLEHIYEEVKEVKELIKIQNGRVQKLERFRTGVMWAMSAIVTLLGLGLVRLVI